MGRLEEYWRVADPYYFGGDLTLLTWDESLLTVIENWVPETTGAPLIQLPDSGTVDIQPARFREALDRGQVIVDEASVEASLRSMDPWRPPPVHMIETTKYMMGFMW